MAPTVSSWDNGGRSCCGWNLIGRAEVIRLATGGALLTLAINAVGLVSPLFFTQVYDRVLSTGSAPTLLALVIAALIAGK